MSVAEWVFLGEAAVSGVAFIASFIALKKGKAKTSKTLLQVAEKANDKATKTFNKVCKKYKVDSNEALIELQNKEKGE